VIHHCQNILESTNRGIPDLEKIIQNHDERAVIFSQRGCYFTSNLERQAGGSYDETVHESKVVNS
jgi:hypothetical protein